MAPVLAKPIADLEIQEWVRGHYGYVPHPYWIGHCKELYLDETGLLEEKRPWHRCPPEKQLQIRAGFVHFGLLVA